MRENEWEDGGREKEKEKRERKVAYFHTRQKTSYEYMYYLNHFTVSSFHTYINIHVGGGGSQSSSSACILSHDTN